MLRRKTIIVLVITLMVTAMVCAFSYLYISQIMRLRIANAYETATNLTHQLAYAAGNTVPDFSSTAVDTSDPASVNRAVADYVQTDVDLNNLLQSDPGDWRFIYDVAILDTNGKALLHTNASMVGRIVPPRPDFQQVVRARFRDQIRLVFSPAAVYDVSYPLTLNGAPFGMIRIGVQTIFLKSEVATRMMKSLYISLAVVFVSFLLAAGI
jgi:uncharacterized membrane protein affecting hemolysin expression